MLAAGDQFAGYRIEGILGRGGMGIVYEATQTALQRRVALKVLPAELGRDAAFRERFRREGVLQARLDHPHIVTVHEAGEFADSLFLAMRLIPGATLKELVRSGQLDVPRALRVLGGVADALDDAHAAGLIHRDVKPQNVLVDERDHPYLADFGLTRTPEATVLTQTDQFVGTVDYVAPEQIEGRPATAASDIYSFTAVLFECLTGSVPYPRESQAAVLWAHVSDAAPRVTDMRGDLPRALDGVVARGMAREPEARHERAGEVVADAWEALDVVGATAPAPVGRSGGAATAPTLPATAAPVARSRRRLGAGLAAVAVIGVVASLIVFGRGGGLPGGRDPFTLGSALRVPMDETFHCDNSVDVPCVVMQARLPGNTVVAPRDGKLRRWRVKNAKGTFRLVVLRPSGTRWAVVRRSDPVTIDTRDVKTLAADDVPIHKGDAIGLDMDARATVGWHYEAKGADLFRWTQLASAPLEPESTGPKGYEMALAADVSP